MGLYCECLDFFQVNDISNAGERFKAIMLSVCGLKTYQLICMLCSPEGVNTKEKTYENIVNLVAEHQNPKSSVILQ